MRKITEIFVHCAATKPEWMADKGVSDKRAEINRWHKDRGWKGIGYHILIDRDGSEAVGRAESDTGAHAKGHNANSLAVCLVGGHDAKATDKFSDHFTVKQDAALRLRLKTWLAKHPHAILRGHNEVSPKGCPGFNVQEWWAKPPKTPASKPPVGLAAAIVAACAALYFWLRNKWRKDE